MVGSVFGGEPVRCQGFALRIFVFLGLADPSCGGIGCLEAGLGARKWCQLLLLAPEFSPTLVLFADLTAKTHGRGTDPLVFYTI